MRRLESVKRLQDRAYVSLLRPFKQSRRGRRHNPNPGRRRSKMDTFE